MYEGVPVLDLDYDEDSQCDTDMNVVMTGAGGFVEVQGTAEGVPFSRDEMNALLDLAQRRHQTLIAKQKAALELRVSDLERPTLTALKRVVLASNNAGKLREFAALLGAAGIELIAQGELGVPEAEEPHPTFVENALAKARHAAKLTGLPALADDSGLCVHALRGAPGVYSARYAQLAGGEKSDAANNARLVAATGGRGGPSRVLLLRARARASRGRPRTADRRRPLAWRSDRCAARRERLRLRPALLPACVERKRRRTRSRA